MDLELQGQSVDRVCFDAAVAVLTSGGYEFRIETELVFRTSTGVSIRIEPEHAGHGEVAHLVRLVGEPIAVAESRSDGGLMIEFVSGALITVAPSVDYEAWGLVGPGGSRVISMPGGEVAVWSQA